MLQQRPDGDGNAGLENVSEVRGLWGPMNKGDGLGGGVHRHEIGWIFGSLFQVLEIVMVRTSIRPNVSLYPSFQLHHPTGGQI